MKLIVTIAGQDTGRLAERIEQLVRERTASATLTTGDDPNAPPPQSSQRARRDRRS